MQVIMAQDLSVSWMLWVAGGWQEFPGREGLLREGHFSQGEFLSHVLKEVLSWLKGVIDFRVFAIMNPKKSDTKVLKTWL